MSNITLATILEGRDTTTGAVTVEILGNLGASFTLCQPVGERYKGKEPIGHTWRDTPHTTERALSHIQANKGRNNIGILTGWGGWVSYDCDRMAAEFLTGAGLDDGLIVYRRNALDRCKVLLLCSDPDNLPDTVTTIRATDGGGNFLEASGQRSNVVVAGTHHTGATVEMVEGRLHIKTAAELGRIVDDYREWLTGKGYAIVADPPPSAHLVNSKPSIAPATPVKAGRLVDWATLAHEAIEWMIAQGAYRTDAARLLSNSKRAGGAFALRPEKVPSTRRTDMRDSFHKQTYRDYGTNETRDEFELAVMATGRDRREMVNAAIDEYLQATQGRTLESLRAELTIAAQRKRERQVRDVAMMGGR